jgi:hypothetical protein
MTPTGAPRRGVDLPPGHCFRRDAHLLLQYVLLPRIAARKAIRLTLSIILRVKGNLNED